MVQLVIDLAFAVIMASAGAGAGWWLRGSRGRHEAGQYRREYRRVRQVLSKLQDVATSVASDVGAHAGRVQQINDELNSAKDPKSEVVVATVAKLIETNSEMQRQLVSAEEKLRAQEKMIESHLAEARTDELTQLANRRAFDQELARRLAETRRSGTPLSLLLLDVDHFKSVNDRRGHQAGDEVLRNIGFLLREHVHEPQMPARYGGEEFAVVLPRISAEAASLVAEQLRQSIARHRFGVRGEEFHVTVSVGLADATPKDDAQSLIGRSDAALYASKDAGRNCTSWHDGQTVRSLRKTPPASPTCATRNPAPSITSETPTPAPRSAPPAAAPLQKLNVTPRKIPSQPAAPIVERVEPDSAATQRCCRTEFCVALARGVTEWTRNSAPASMLLVAIDGYRGLRTSLGGDMVRDVQDALVRLLGTSARKAELVGEFDSSVLGVVFSETSLAEAMGVAEWLRETVAKSSAQGENGPPRITISVGAAETRGGEDMLLWARRAEIALQTAATLGGHCSCYHNGDKALPLDRKLIAAAAATAPPLGDLSLPTATPHNPVS